METVLATIVAYALVIWFILAVILLGAGFGYLAKTYLFPKPYKIVPMKKFTDADLDAFMEDNKDLMKSLAECLVCPVCHKVVRPPFYNLGLKHNWAEGCEPCWIKGQNAD
jgi:hypothetical protein